MKLPMIESEPFEDGLRIRGVVAIPRVSRNGYFYPPEELEKAVKRLSGKPIPIYFEHVSADRAAGYAFLRWNPEKLQVEFEGVVVDRDVAEKIRRGIIQHVSLGADYYTLEPMNGYNIVRGLEFRELSLVAVPGMPEARVETVEKLMLLERLETKNPLKRRNPSMNGRKQSENTAQTLRKASEELRKAIEKVYKMMDVEVVEENIGGGETDYDAIARRLRESLTSSSAPTIPQWTPPIINLPPGVEAGLRKYTRLAVLPRGTSKAVVTRITTPSFSLLTEGSEISDAAQTMDNVEIETQEYGAAQTVTDTVMESMTGDLVQAIERALQRAAIRNEDKVLINALQSASGIDVIYGGGKTAEADLTSDDRLTWRLVLEAKKKIMEKGRDVGEGRLALLLHPKQWLDLMNDVGANLVAAGDRAFVESGEVLRLFGVDIVVSDQLPTGTGSGGITTYHGFMFVKEEALGLAVTRDLRIELDRDINKRTTSIVATHRVGAAVIDGDSALRIVTA